MKNKPTRHKESNTFKFQSFTERIANIDVDIFHRVGHKYEDDERSETYFYKTLEKLSDLNLTESFESFRKEVPASHTLPQLLQQKSEIVAVLIKYVKLKDPLSLQPILELVVAFARDLRQEFYPYYSDIVRHLIDLLNTKDSEQLEWTFTCLAYLFKYLWRHLVKDVRVVFTELLPLLEDSRPDYINNFAAESFAFVARKVKDKKAFLLLVLKTLNKHPDGVPGCGHLLFEVMKGVSEQFHSCADGMLPLMFEMLANESLPENLLFEVLTHTVAAAVRFINPKKGGLYWTSAFNTIEMFILSSEMDTVNKCKSIELVLKLVLQAVNFKNAVFVADPVFIVQKTIELLKQEIVNESIMLVLSEIGATLLMSPAVRLPQEYASHITLKMLAIPYNSVLQVFVGRILSYPAFEVLVLPQLMRRCQTLLLNDNINGVAGIGRDFLNLLTQMVLYKAPLCRTGMDLKYWRQYPLNFTINPNRTRPGKKDIEDTGLCIHFLNELCIGNVEELLQRTEDLLCIVICLPHLRSLDQEMALNQLKRLVMLLSSSLKETSCNVDSEHVNSDSEEERKSDCDIVSKKSNERTNILLVLLGTILETAIHLTDDRMLQEICNFDVLMEALCPYTTNPNYLSSLRALDLCITAYKLEAEDSVYCLELFQKLYAELLPNLSSPFHEVRLLSLHILSLFEKHSEYSNGAGIIDWPIFSQCLAAELVPPTVHEYRGKLQCLESLEFSAAQVNLLKYPEYDKAPLHFLLGNLYINFQLLWEPVCNLIASYARGMSMTVFWEIFRPKLQSTTQEIKCSRQDAPSLLIQRDFLLNYFTTLNQLDEKPDYFNYRLLLWKAMAKFPEVCESKNRDLSPLFLTFIDEEYFRSNAEMAYSWNIKHKIKIPDQKVDCGGDNEDSNMEVSEDEDGNKDLEMRRPKKDLGFSRSQPTGRILLKTLLSHMNIFSKMKDPRSVYREADLKKAYLDFLTHKNPEVQKMAVDCIMTYKYKYLLPYREHVYGLIDDKTFKMELTVFRIDKESEIIQKEHRSELIPVIMRIVYSKMVSKTGVRYGGTAHLRRSLVLRFLAGCHENEMIVFVEMAFRIYADFIQDDPVALVDSVLERQDLECVVPPKRLQSSINLLSVMLDKFGRLMGQKLLPYLLRVLLCISANVYGALKQRDSVHPGYVPILLTLRNSCQEIMARFFDHFDNYIWSEAEVETVFRVMVWPWLEKLPVEGIHSPTALLKLFLVWSKHPRYFILLANHAEGNEKLSVLPSVIELLLRKQTHPSVTTAIMELVERLLTLQDYQSEETQDGAMIPEIPVSMVVPVDSQSVRKLSGGENLNYGSCLLFAHIPAILERLEHKLASLKNKNLSHRELTVLSRATELVWDPSTSDTLLRLLLPLLGKKAGGGEETVSHLITTLENLFRNVKQPEKHLRSLAPLFAEVSATGPRKLLNSVLETVAMCSSEERKEHLIRSTQLISRLNAFDAKWVEQPDFNQRLDAFKEVHAMLENGQIDLDFAVIIIHNCYYFIKIEKDLSLRDSASYCLRKVAPAVCLQYKDCPAELEFLVSDTLLNLIRVGVRDKNEVVQQESVRLLGEMARECADLHPVLQDLSKLANKVDPEVDFFENLLHLQSHRKSRALLKFCQVAKELTKPPTPRTLTHFILPLASMYLCSEKYAHKNNMVDAAVETVGTVCGLLPWHQYETILRFYLTKLRYQVEFQKQLVRVVVAILDAFHFDLSRARVSLTKDHKKNVSKENTDLMDVENSQSEENLNHKQKHTDADNDTSVKLKDRKGGMLVDTNYFPEDNESKPLEETGTEELADKLENLLDIENDISKTEEEEEKKFEVTSNVVPAIERQTTLSKSVATHVIQIITTGLLPQIHRVMAQLTQTEVSHKFNKKQTAVEKEEEGILRVPIALAAVKLLQRLPSYMLDQNLPGILMKLCTFLKSRLESIRRVTRETLQKIMVTLGPKYLGPLLREMTAMLTRGYQVHVLIYTFHAVLVSLKELFQPGDIDCCLQSILELCRKDLFGAAAEEKEVNQITGKLHEARATKSFDTFQILAQFISEKCLVDLILPIREVLMNSHSFKIIHKCSECLRRIVLGLVDNRFLAVESLLLFTYGITSESIPDLVLGMKKEVITPAQKELLARQQLDTFIIPQAPRNRTGFNNTARTSSRTNAHIVIEFGLRLLHIILRREKLRMGDFRPLIDSLVPIFCDCLKAQHIKLTTVTLNCMSWILKMDLPALRENIKGITMSVFKLLHKYAAAGLGKGNNFDLVVAAFKVVAVLVRDVKYHTIDADQMKALLLYAEQDMHDFNRQATAFALLKAVLARKLVAPEIHDVMDKVAKLSITSEFAHVRLQARQVFHQFLMDYPLGKKLDRHLAFYISQLNYEVQSGRESALEMVQSLITSFPVKVLTDQAGLLFVTLGVQLVNDEAPKCRKMVAHNIKIMLERLDKNGRDQLFDIVILWLKDMKVEHRRLAAQLCGIFVTVEKSDFETRLTVLMPLVVRQFNSNFGDDDIPGKFVKIMRVNEVSRINFKKDEQMRDHLLFQVFQLILKMCTSCPIVLTDPKWQENMETVTENAQVLLAHPHEWVRLGAAQLFGSLFGSLDADKVAEAASGHSEVSSQECGYFAHDTKQRLKSLILDTCAQLQPIQVGAELVEQVVKNLVFLGRVLKRISLGTQADENEKQDCKEESSDQIKLSLLWMVRRMRKIINIEIVQAPKSVTLRTAVFKWIGAIVLDLGREGLPSVAYQLLAPLARELVSTDESNSGKQLHQLTKQVSDLIKKKLGMEVYMQHLSRLQIKLASKRSDRKKLRAQEVLTKPEKAAKRKIKKHLKKREAKKKKVEKIKGKKI